MAVVRVNGKKYTKDEDFKNLSSTCQTDRYVSDDGDVILGVDGGYGKFKLFMYPVFINIEDE